MLAGEQLTTYSSEQYQNITVSSCDSTKVFQAWKVKSSAGVDLPEIECLRSTVKLQEGQEVVRSSSAVSSDMHSTSHTPTPEQDSSDTDNTIDHDQLDTILEREWGYQLRQDQREAITCVLQRQDCFVTLPTGRGKSIILMLPSYQFHGLTIVVLPLKSLMDDQLRICAAHNIDASALHGDLSDSERQSIYMCLKQPVCPLKILYVLPEIIAKDRKVFF